MSILNKIDKTSLPKHVAIIMDGNGRWAANQNKPRIYGHKYAVNSVRACVEASAELKIPVLTLYAFSTENWQRPKKEVSALMNLFFEFLGKELDTMLKHNIRFRLIGDRTRLPDFLQDRLSFALNSTSKNSGLLLNVALNYGGRDDIVRAVRKIAENVKKGHLQPENVDESLISANTFTSGIEDPDLIIRTSGELRISNFLIWQSAYAEYYFTEVLWPDFTKENLYEAIVSFQRRKRRLGRITNFKKNPEQINEIYLSKSIVKN
tara:strand:+ start:146 stop:937 length:792 start_codon:yes stop_codon:yes gene_type:complete